MKRYLAGATLLLVLAACQANEPQKAAQPASEPVPPAAQETTPAATVKAAAEQGADAMKESAAQAASAAKAKAEKIAAKARAQAEAAQAKVMAEAAQAKAMAASQMADSLAKAKKVVQPAATKEAAPAKAAAAAMPAAAASGDVASGKTLARKCAACHNFDAKNKVGPGLGGVFNRAAGSMAGFNYKFTASIKPGKAWRWDATHLAAWVCDAGKAVREFTGDAAAKTKMPAQRVCDPVQQADLIAYLKTL